MLKNMRQDKILSGMFLLTISLFNLMTGAYFLLADPEGGSSSTYATMEGLMPLSIYGVLLVASSVALIIGIFAEDSSKQKMYVIGGIFGALVLGLYASASSLEGANLMLPLRYALLSISCLIIAVSGGFELWKITRVT